MNKEKLFAEMIAASVENKNNMLSQLFSLMELKEAKEEFLHPETFFGIVELYTDEWHKRVNL